MDKKRIAVLLSALFAMTSLVSAQTQAPKPPAAMVYVPVGVTGPKGAVLDLKKDNFVLLEDGIEQTLTAFYEPNSRIDIDIILAMRALNKGRTDLGTECAGRDRRVPQRGAGPGQMAVPCLLMPAQVE